MSEGESIEVERDRVKRLTRMLFSLAGGEGEGIEAFEPTRDEFGKLERTFLAFVEEFGSAKRRAAQLETERAAVIAAQAHLIDELAAPAIELGEGVVVVPLVGSLSEARIAKLSASLLERVVAKSIRVVLLDLSGIDLIDTHIGLRLSQLCRSLALLGARSVVTGIRPALAGTLASLDIELGASTARTVREGLRLVSVD